MNERTTHEHYRDGFQEGYRISRGIYGGLFLIALATFGSVQYINKRIAKKQEIAAIEAISMEHYIPVGNGGVVGALNGENTSRREAANEGVTNRRAHLENWMKYGNKSIGRSRMRTYLANTNPAEAEIIYGEEAVEQELKMVDFK